MLARDPYGFGNLVALATHEALRRGAILADILRLDELLGGRIIGAWPPSQTHVGKLHLTALVAEAVGDARS